MDGWNIVPVSRAVSASSEALATSISVRAMDWERIISLTEKVHT